MSTLQALVSRGICRLLRHPRREYQHNLSVIEHSYRTGEPFLVFLGHSIWKCQDCGCITTSRRMQLGEADSPAWPSWTRREPQAGSVRRGTGARNQKINV